MRIIPQSLPEKPAPSPANWFESAGLHLLDQLDVIRRKHSGSLPPPCDYYMRSMEAVIARAAGYESRNEWTDALKADEQSRYFRDLQLVETCSNF